MDQIRKAVERAKAERLAGQAPVAERARQLDQPPEMPARLAGRSLTIPNSMLERHRIVAHDTRNEATLGFDLLRTKITQHMKTNGFKTLLITSPSPECGKTVTAINLAFSLARQSELLITALDLDLRKPQMATYLDIPHGSDIMSVLSGDATLSEALVGVSAMGPEFLLLPTLRPFEHPAETLSSPAMRNLLHGAKQLSEQVLIIIDTPPLLFADDVIALVPQVDAVLLVVAAGQSTTREVEGCRKLVSADKLLGVVLTKANSSRDEFYGYGGQ
jgi:protein-tyrosine kinase